MLFHQKNLVLGVAVVWSVLDVVLYQLVFEVPYANGLFGDLNIGDSDFEDSSYPRNGPKPRTPSRQKLMLQLPSNKQKLGTQIDTWIDFCQFGKKEIKGI